MSQASTLDQRAGLPHVATTTPRETSRSSTRTSSSAGATHASGSRIWRRSSSGRPPATARAWGSTDPHLTARPQRASQSCGFADRIDDLPANSEQESRRGRFALVSMVVDFDLAPRPPFRRVPPQLRQPRPSALVICSTDSARAASGSSHAESTYAPTSSVRSAALVAFATAATPGMKLTERLSTARAPRPASWVPMMARHGIFSRASPRRCATERVSSAKTGTRTISSASGMGESTAPMTAATMLVR